MARNQLSLAFAQTHLEPQAFWQRRYFDFNVYSRKKMWKKFDYMHANPVTGRLVEQPHDWPWSSWTCYATVEDILKIDAIRERKTSRKEKKPPFDQSNAREEPTHPFKDRKGRPPEVILTLKEAPPATADRASH